MYSVFWPSSDFEMMETGSEAGTLRNVYGRVTADGMGMNGETVNGSCASSRCDPVGVSY